MNARTRQFVNFRLRFAGTSGAQRAPISSQIILDKSTFDIRAYNCNVYIYIYIFGIDIKSQLHVYSILDKLELTKRNCARENARESRAGREEMRGDTTEIFIPPLRNTYLIYL